MHKNFLATQKGKSMHFSGFVPSLFQTPITAATFSSSTASLEKEAANACNAASTT
jgi:hypothetical protein